MRLLKQFLYGFFYLAIFGGIFWWIYSATLRPAPTCFDEKQNQEETGIDCGGPCISCEVKNLKPLSIGGITSLFGDDRIFSVAAEVKNPNADYGTRNFSYEADFYDSSSRLLGVEKGIDFIYPGENKYIIVAGIKIGNGIPVRAEIKLINQSEIKWEKKNDFIPLSAEFKNVLAELENNQVIISGYVINVNNFEFSRVVVSAFAVDNMGIKVGASKTETKIGPFGAWNFNIFIPVNKTLIKNIDLDATVKSAVVGVLK